MYGLFAVGFAAIVASLVAIANFQANITTNTPPMTTMKALASGQVFILYRNEVLTFIENNPGYTGTVQVEQLELPEGVSSKTFPAGTSNEVISDGNGGYDIYVWSPGSATANAEIAQVTHGDLSYGYVEGGEWVNPAQGIMGEVPSGVADGDLFSAVQIGN